MALDAHPGQALRWKLRYSVRPKCHPLLLDNNLNSRGTVLLNVYQLFLLTAYKFHTYAKELPKGECSLFSLIVVMMMMMMMMMMIMIVFAIPFYTLSSIHSAKVSGAKLSHIRVDQMPNPSITRQTLHYPPKCFPSNPRLTGKF